LTKQKNLKALLGTAAFELVFGSSAVYAAGCAVGATVEGLIDAEVAEYFVPIPGTARCVIRRLKDCDAPVKKDN
jgi:hypothetical protein